jgi:hypothetical protein
VRDFYVPPSPRAFLTFHWEPVLQIFLIVWPLHPLLLSDQSVDEIVLGAYGIDAGSTILVSTLIIGRLLFLRKRHVGLMGEWRPGT